MRIYAIREKFAKTRMLKGMSQRDLARATGLSHAYISMIERTLKSVGPSAAIKLSEALETSPEELFQISEQH